MPYATRRIWDPALYQGGSIRRRYFEGWYFKQVDEAGERTLAVIPGVSFSEDGLTRHAFVQTVPAGGRSHYFSFPEATFAWDRETFRVSVAGNRFDSTGMTLELEDGDASASGTLTFGPWSPWPVRRLSPGIMGWYRFVPGMETYHGVLSMDHQVDGELVIDGERWSFAGGRGYVEKDWGRSFPSSWIWAQSNTFDQPGISLMLSVAKIPWLGSSFVGHIAGLLLDGTLHRFATYTGAKPVAVETAGDRARIVLADRREELEVVLESREVVVLKAPVLGSMEGRDAESLGGTVEVTLRSIRGGRPEVLFAGTGRQAGIEIMDPKCELQTR